MLFNKFHIFFFLMLGNLVVFSQLDGAKQKDTWMEDNIFLDGKVTDYYTGEIISGVNITATSGGTVSASGNSDENGEYKTVLEYDKTYTITFSKSGYTSKIITMNTNGVPDIKRQKVPDMGAEITLFKPNECVKTDILNLPIGKAVYFPNKNIMDWDMEYSMPRLEKLNKILDKCAKQAEEEKKAEEEKEKKYNDLMRSADKTFSKEEYEAALADYKSSSLLYPERPEPKNKITLIETELAKKAEAEKQRAEEKNRAEAEALAKAAAETAEKNEAEERLAKEKAEAEVLAKTTAAANEKAKAESAAKKAEEEKLAKEKKEAEAKAKKEVEEKAKLEKEAAAKKIAEEKARNEETAALTQMAVEEKAKIAAQKEAKHRADAEAKALEEKLAAKKREVEERKAKEIAGQLAQKAEEERAINAVVLLEVKAEVTVKVEKQEAQEKINTVIEFKEDPQSNGEINNSSTIKFKSKNKSRQLYVKPNKHKKGQGPQPKKRIVF